MVGETFREGRLQQAFVAGVPEIVEDADRLQGCFALRIGDRCGDDELVDLDAVGGKSRCGQRERQRGEKPKRQGLPQERKGRSSVKEPPPAS